MLFFHFLAAAWKIARLPEKNYFARLWGGCRSHAYVVGAVYVQSYRRRRALGDSTPHRYKQLSHCRTARSAGDTGSRPACRVHACALGRCAAPPAARTSALTLWRHCRLSVAPLPLHRRVDSCLLQLRILSFYYWYSITHSLSHSRLKSVLFCESSLPQPFLFLLQDSLYGFPRLFTATSEHIRLFTF